MKNKEIETETDRDFFLKDLILCMEQSEGVYGSFPAKLVAISTLEIIFDELDITSFIEQKDVSKADYKKWFKEPAEHYGYDEVIYDVLFNSEAENENEK